MISAGALASWNAPTARLGQPARARHDSPLDPNPRNAIRSDAARRQSSLGGGGWPPQDPTRQEARPLPSDPPRVFRGFDKTPPATAGLSAQEPAPSALSARMAAALTGPAPAPSAPEHAAEDQSLLCVIAVRALLERGQTVRARVVLDAALMTVGPNPTLLRLQRLLEPPRVTPVARTDRDRTPEYRWLREHGPEYRGQWVAVLGDRLMACAPSFRELRARLAAQTLPYPPLVEHILAA